VPVANQYPWCSAAWFERTATPAQIKTIYNFKIDRLQLYDGFAPEWQPASAPQL
jgi:putative transposase